MNILLLSENEEIPFEWMVQLVEDNVASFYEESSWGYSRSVIEKELSHPGMKFLIAYAPNPMSSDPKGEMIGYLAFLPTTETVRGHYHLRWTRRKQEPVLYCYELQIVPSHRGIGLGRALMNQLVEIATAMSIKRVVLTCFTANEKAWNFYTKHLSYCVDYQNSEYGILSLVLPTS